MSKNKKVLISGALGQVGKRCAEYLLARGHAVIAFDLSNAKTIAVEQQLRARFPQSEKLIVIYGDMLDRDAVSGLFKMHCPDVVIHLAAVVSPVCYRNPEFAHRVNVEGTENLITAARELAIAPLFVFASSAAVYGSINPYKFKERITPNTPVNPIDCYGEDKVQAEMLLIQSGLPHTFLRLGGVMSPDTLVNANSDYELLMRATPRDNRIHGIDARDAALAFANTVEQPDAVDGKSFLIAGNDSYALLSRCLEDDMMETMGIGRLGSDFGLPGDPNDDDGWSFTGWFDTTESQAILNYQNHNWDETRSWLSSTQSTLTRHFLRVAGPLIRSHLKRLALKNQKKDRRGPYIMPWDLIGKTYGEKVLVARKRQC